MERHLYVMSLKHCKSVWSSNFQIEIRSSGNNSLRQNTFSFFFEYSLTVIGYSYTFRFSASYEYDYNSTVIRGKTLCYLFFSDTLKTVASVQAKGFNVERQP